MAGEIGLYSEKNVLALFDEIGAQVEASFSGNKKLFDYFKACICTAYQRLPSLHQCTKASQAMAIQQGAQSGMEITLGQCCILPYRNNKTGQLEAQFQPMYKGLVKVAHNTGYIADIYAEVVREGDAFRYVAGSDPRIEHEPNLNAATPGRLLHVYAVARMHAGGTSNCVIPGREVLAIKERSKAFQNRSGPWITDEPEQWKKTAIKRLCKVLPAAVIPQHIRVMIEQEDEIEYGAGRDSIKIKHPSPTIEATVKDVTPPPPIDFDSAEPPAEPTPPHDAAPEPAGETSAPVPAPGAAKAPPSACISEKQVKLVWAKLFAGLDRNDKAGKEDRQAAFREVLNVAGIAHTNEIPRDRMDEILKAVDAIAAGRQPGEET